MVSPSFMENMNRENFGLFVRDLKASIRYQHTIINQLQLGKNDPYVSGVRDLETHILADISRWETSFPNRPNCNEC